MNSADILILKDEWLKYKHEWLVELNLAVYQNACQTKLPSYTYFLRYSIYSVLAYECM